MSWIGSVCSAAPRTRLADYAASLAKSGGLEKARNDLLFPMYVVFIEAWPNLQSLALGKDLKWCFLYAVM